jgi:hypothetical protein
MPVPPRNRRLCRLRPFRGGPAALIRGCVLAILGSGLLALIVGRTGDAADRGLPGRTALPPVTSETGHAGLPQAVAPTTAPPARAVLRPAATATPRATQRLKRSAIGPHAVRPLHPSRSGMPSVAASGKVVPRPTPKPRATSKPTPRAAPKPVQPLVGPADRSLPTTLASAGGGSQLVTVVGARPGSTTGTLAWWRRGSSGWMRVGTAPARFGSHGLTDGRTRVQGTNTTPTGIVPQVYRGVCDTSPCRDLRED